MDPAEAERLAAKIAAIGPPSDRDGDGKRQMRDLLQKQLDLLRGFESRLPGLKDRRARRLELLRALWLQVTELGSAAGNDGTTSGATDRIRTLCAEIVTQMGGASADTEATEAISDAPTIERT